MSDPHAERPLYKLFYGTTAYASPEILRREPYQAPPAEIWTLGVLLTYLLTGASPFCSENDALEGLITLRAPPTSADGNDPEVGLSTAALDLLTRCLVVNIEDRADINEVRAHPWLHGALHRRPNTSCV
jgi:serine/threonine protein kinase